MKLTKLQQLAVGLGLVVIAFVLAEYVFLKGKKDNLATLQTRCADLEAKIRLAESIRDRVNELREEMDHLRAQLDRLKDVLPTAVNKPLFMADIKRYANENGIEIASVSQNKEVLDDVIMEHPFSFVAFGGYHDFGKFFAQLSDYPRIVNVKGLQLDRLEAGPYPVQGTFLISVFTYKEPTKEDLRKQVEERKAAKRGEGAPNRGRR